MNTSELMSDVFGRVKSLVHRSVTDLDVEGLIFRVDPDANSIAWLVWHLTRIQDDHIAHLASVDQAWPDWAHRFDMEPDLGNLGIGHTSAEVGQLRPDEPDVLLGYHDVVHAATLRYLTTIDEDELDRIVDRSWDPPVSAGVRLVSVTSDNLQHGGQALYIRGLLDRMA